MFFKKKKQTELTKEQLLEHEIPKHVAIILDGNGRWAKRRGLPRTAGHKEGALNVQRMTKLCADIGVEALTVYAFSTENWKRPAEEVNFLMKLPIQFFEQFTPELMENGVRLKVMGNVEQLPQELQLKIIEIEKKTKDNNKLTINIALNYGSRDEIKQAVQAIAAKVQANELDAADITEEMISDHLWTSDLPPLDLMIRTSGEERISNFLLWQLAYAELYFTDVCWPDFNAQEFYKAIASYQKRHRRFGGLEQKK